MAIAGYSASVTCSTGIASTFTEMGGIKSFKIGDSRDLLDVTDFADGNVRSRITALRDIKVDLSGDYEGADAGWLKMLACYQNGTDCFLKLYTSAVAATAGFGYTMQVASMDINSAADGKTEVSVSLMVNGSGGTPTFSL